MTIEIGEVVPTYITVDPNTGLTGADFTGKVHAQGIILPSGFAWPTSDENAIEWRRTSDDELADDLAGIDGGLFARSIAGTPAGSSEVDLVAADDTGATQTALVVDQSNAGAVSRIRFAIAAGFLKTLLDQAGNSEFLQLVSTQKLAIDAGTVNVTWPGGSAASSTININHALGRGAKATLVSPSDQSDGSGNASMRVLTRNGNPSQVILIAGYTPAAGVSNTCSWIVVG